MAADLARTHFSRSRDLATKAGRLVDEAVNHVRNRGLTRERAILQVADTLGLEPRRTKKLIYNELDTLSSTEYRDILLRFQRHLDAEAQDLSSRLANVKRRRRQLEAQHGSADFAVDASGDRDAAALHCRG